VLSLALGIGANTAIFQLLDAVLLRALPVENPQQLAEVRIVNATEFRGSTNSAYAAATYPLWKQVRDGRRFRESSRGLMTSSI
jgi:hypothetical protein